MIRPVATIFAGVNGAGKTTLYFHALNKMINFGYRINMDEIAQSIGSWKDPETQMKAARLALKMRKMCLRDSLSFNLETTLCGHSILKLFEELKKKNYEIALFYVGVDTVEIAKERVRKRVEKGGHGIEEDVIERRFYENQKNLLNVASFCDVIYFYDNSEHFNHVATIEKEKFEILNDNCAWIQELVNKLKSSSTTTNNSFSMSPF